MRCWQFPPINSKERGMGQWPPDERDISAPKQRHTSPSRFPCPMIIRYNHQRVTVAFTPSPSHPTCYTHSHLLLPLHSSSFFPNPTSALDSWVIHAYWCWCCFHFCCIWVLKQDSFCTPCTWRVFAPVNSNSVLVGKKGGPFSYLKLLPGAASGGRTCTRV